MAAPTVAAVRRRIAVVRPMTALAGTGVVLVLLLAPYAKQWLDQRGRLNELRREVAQSERTVAELEQQRRRWEDPAFVAAQARSRLNFARPGETVYVVVDDRPRPEPVDDLPHAAREAARPDRPWFADLWSSVEAAGQPSPSATPTPLVTPTPSATGSPSPSRTGAPTPSPTRSARPSTSSSAPARPTGTP